MTRIKAGQKKRTLKKKRREQIFKKLLKIAKHGEECTCKDKDCIELRKSLKEWRIKMQPLIDAIEDSTRLTAEDYAVTINARAEDM